MLADVHSMRELEAITNERIETISKVYKRWDHDALYQRKLKVELMALYLLRDKAQQHNKEHINHAD